MGRVAHPLGTSVAVTCRACTQVFVWTRTAAHRRQPTYCADPVCQRRRSNLRSTLYQRRVRGLARAYQADPSRFPVAPPLPQPTPEPTAVVERLLAQATAARLAEERRQGQRRYTVDPWAQRPGANDFERDGDTNGWGW